MPHNHGKIPQKSRDFQDLTGKKFGKLTVIEYAGSVKGHPTWLCECDCIENTELRIRKIIESGNLKRCVSCGCSKTKRFTTHGKSGTKEYTSWHQMKNRCLCKNDRAYPDYGGRGIKICDEWINSFEKFYTDMGPKPTVKHSIERIDVNGNYSPENCRWATATEQANNTRRNILIEYRGKTQTAAEWSRELNIRYGTLLHRHHKGQDIGAPVKIQNRKIKKSI